MVKKRILVCGATGFIGRNAAERLAKREDCEVWGTFHSLPYVGTYEDAGVRIIGVDLTRRDDVDLVFRIVHPDVVIQAAAVTTGVKDVKERPYIHITDNVIMNELLRRAVYKHSVPRFIFLSCSVMYDQTMTVPLAEEDIDLNQPFFPAYFGGAWMKVANEKMCEFYSRLGRTRFVVIRHSNVYGPHDKFDLERSHVFGATMTKVMTAPEGGKVVVWGDGSEERDLLYVADLVDFIEVVAILDREIVPFDIVNIGAGQTISVRDLVAKIIQASGKNLSIEYDSSKPQVKTRLCLDVAKALSTYGWVPRVPLDVGIRLTMDWWKAKNGIASNPQSGSQ